MLWLLPVGALLPAFLSFMFDWNQLSKGRIPAVHWEELLRGNLFMHAVFMSPALFALFAGYGFAREYQEKTVAVLWTYARPRWQSAAAKITVLLAIIAAALALSPAGCVLPGVSVSSILG
jgi:ABC-type transport system involved in multi-copper enzyme maturation permease subunit